MTMALAAFPVDPSAKPRYSDDFGAPRGNPPGSRRHQGNDIFAPEGTKLLAVEDGTIGRAYVDPLGGNAVTLIGASGTRYYYAHLKGWAWGIKDGAKVAAAEVVGYLGHTGDAQGTPNHLHFEVHPGGGPAVDPYPYLQAAPRRAPASSFLALGVVAVAIVAVWAYLEGRR